MGVRCCCAGAYALGRNRVCTAPALVGLGLCECFYTVVGFGCFACTEHVIKQERRCNGT